MSAEHVKVNTPARLYFDLFDSSVGQTDTFKVQRPAIDYLVRRS